MNDDVVSPLPVLWRDRTLAASHRSVRRSGSRKLPRRWDAVPMLIDALPALPPDVQCPLARHMLELWSPDSERSIRSWNWSAAMASNAVREHEASLLSMVGPIGIDGIGNVRRLSTVPNR